MRRFRGPQDKGPDHTLRMCVRYVTYVRVCVCVCREQVPVAVKLGHNHTLGLLQTSLVHHPNGPKLRANKTARRAARNTDMNRCKLCLCEE